MIKKFIPLYFDVVFTGIFNDENNIDILENFISVYFNIPLQKVKGHIEIKSRYIESKAKTEKKKQVDIILDLDGEKINIELKFLERFNLRFSPLNNTFLRIS